MTSTNYALFSLVPIVFAFSIWKAKRDLRKERASMKSEFLQHRQDFLSIWALANAWAEEEPITSSADEIPLEVKRYIGKLILAYFRKELSLRTKDGFRIIGHGTFEKLFDIDKGFEQLWKCLTQAPDIAFLDGVYVMRSEVIRWCEAEFIEPPRLWKPVTDNDETPKKKPAGRHYTEEIDKNRCQAIAMAYWDIDPSIHPAHMAKSYAIRKFGNGEMYKDADTVKKWITELDPQAKDRNSGRPPTAPYKIDLKLPVSGNNGTSE